MKKFWNWKKKVINLENGQEAEERILFMNGVIAEDSWFDDDVTPALFKDELNAVSDQWKYDKITGCRYLCRIWKGEGYW